MVETILRLPRPKRRAALRELAAPDAQPVVDALEATLADPALGRLALDALGWLHGPYALDALTRALEHPELGPVAAKIIGRRRDPDAAARLVARYRTASDDEALRRGIVTGLARIGAPALAWMAWYRDGDLVQIARGAGPAAFDRVPLRVLRALGDPRAIPFFLSHLGDRSWHDAYRAFAAATEIGGRFPDVLLAEIARLGIGDTPSGVLLRATAGDRSTIPTLVELVQSKRGGPAAIERLGRFRDPATLPALLSAFVPPGAREDSAARAIGGFQGPEPVAPLLELMRDRRVHGWAIAHTLRRLSRWSVPGVVEAARGDVEHWYLDLLAQALGPPGEADTHAMLEALRHPDYVFRKSAIRACHCLGRRHDEALEPALEAMASSDEEPDLRQLAAAVLRTWRRRPGAARSVG